MGRGADEESRKTLTDLGSQMGLLKHSNYFQGFMVTIEQYASG